MKPTVAFLGLGGMGLAMAENLLQAGYKLRVWNRTAEKAAPLVERGAILADSPAAATEPGGIAVTMLADDAALESVTLGPDGLAARLGAGGVHLSMSTVSPPLTKRLAEEHARCGGALVASPVLGKPDAAAARKLFVISAGDAAAQARVRPLQEALGQGVRDFGADPAAASVVKLAVNFLFGAAIEAMAEAFTLAEKQGVPPGKLFELISTTMFACPPYQGYGAMIASGDFLPVGGRPSLLRKDFALILDAARAAAVPMPVAALVYDRLTATVAKGRDDTDWTGFAREVREAAGLRQPA